MSSLGHIIRLRDDNIEKKVCCENKYMRRKAPYTRRYGPRGHWWEDNMKSAYNIITDKDTKTLTMNNYSMKRTKTIMKL